MCGNGAGTLARWWNNEPNSYARVFGYDEEGRLTKIERDYGNGDLQTAYEYGYTGDGVRVWKRDTLNQQEYRYVCRIGCGGVPMRVYNRAIGGASWASVEDYLETSTVTGYTKAEGTFGHYVWTSGHWLGDWEANGGWAYYQDWFGVEVGSVYFPAAVPKPAPEYLGSDEGMMVGSCGDGYVPQYALLLQAAQKDQKPGQRPDKGSKGDPFVECLKACDALREKLLAECWRQFEQCMQKKRPIEDCKAELGKCREKVLPIIAGCKRRCYDLPGASADHPWIVPPGGSVSFGLVTLPVPQGYDVPTDSYDQCYDRYKDKIPGLPKPMPKK